VGHPYKQFIRIPTPTGIDDVWYDKAYYDRVKDKHPDNEVFKLRAYGGGHANVLNQWHNSLISFCLVPYNYDVYVRARADIRLHNKIDFDKYDYSDGKLYVPQTVDWGGITDQFAWGSYQTMKTYYGLYTDYLQKYGYLNPYYPEHYLLEYLLERGVEIIRPNIEISLER